jgi:hypothetical protein
VLTFYCYLLNFQLTFSLKKYIFISSAVIGVVLGLVMITTYSLWKRDDLLTLAIATVIIIGVVCPNNYLIMFANMFNIEPYPLTNYSHFILFFILGVVSIRQLYARLSIRTSDYLFPPYFFLVFAGLVFFACLTESLQFFTFDRTPNFIDLLMDATGLSTGIVLACFVKKQLHK